MLLCDLSLLKNDSQKIENHSLNYANRNYYFQFTYFTKRLVNKDGSFKQFDLIHFRNGYHKNAPAMLVEIIEIGIIKERRNWFFSQKYFEIELGQIVNTNT